MRLGIDFDNTIVCYDALFHRVAREDGVIPAELPVNKSDVRNHLRAVGKEHVWTEMQGRVYGPRMAEASPFPGVLDFFRLCRTLRIPVFIISHKTRRPFAGEPHDLHAAAWAWLAHQGFLDPHHTGLTRDHVFFELTKQAKLERIAACACTHFIDDLPELLAEPSFPSGVVRWLFDPNHLYSTESRFTRITAWSQATDALPPPTSASSPALPIPPVPPTSTPWPEELAPLAEPIQRLLLQTLGPDSQPSRIDPLAGGANNRVYTLRTRPTLLVLKRYFHSAADPRDRFEAERQFYSWTWDHGLRSVPEPLAWDREHRLGLFRFVDGAKLAPSDLRDSHIQQALDFVIALNHDRDHPAARSLPLASESCFSRSQHLDRIDRRVTRLRSFDPITPIDREAATFVREHLAPAWQRLRDRLDPASAPDLDLPLPDHRRCLSPSDFGFHNALHGPDGRLHFLDFEYAGWDDPAKLIGDFFSQPQVPVGLEYWPRFVAQLDQGLGWNGTLESHAAPLLPAYRLKWCCIRLNEFLAGDRARREFAGAANESIEQRKARQLTAARAALRDLEASPAKT